MKNSVTLAICLVLFASHSRAQTLPGELAHLLQLKGNETALVDAVRRFDLQQKALIGWDSDLVRQYSEEGQPDLAQNKEADTQRRLELIREAWRYVLGLYPNDARANNYFGELLYDFLEDKPAGIQHWLLAVRLDEDLSQAHNNLGIHYFHHGDYERGLTHLGKALDLEPENPDYLFNTAQIYLTYFPKIIEKFKMTKEKLFKEAMRMSREAAELAPDDFELVQDYATNFYAAEDFGVEPNWQEAALAWRKANALSRDDHDRFYTLLNEGRTWIKANQPANAQLALDGALGFEPDSRVVKQLLAELAPQS